MNQQELQSLRALIASHKRWDFMFGVLGILALMLGLMTFVALFADMTINGVGRINMDFLTSFPTRRAANAGILSAWVGSVLVMLVTACAAVPLGVAAGVYLEEYAPKNWMTDIIEINVSNLAGVPSIIYGLVGMLIFCNNGTSLLAGALTLTIMNLPTIMRTTQESLKTVPQSYREGAFGLGAGKWRTIRTVVLPSCVDGIVTGCILSIGRILGESAALLFTAGSAHMLYNFFEGMHNAGATLTVALYFYAKESSDTGVVFAIAAILMLLTMLINLIADLVGRYFRRKQQ